MATSAGKLVSIMTPTAQQLTDYANACAAVNLYAYAITQQDMPLLSEPPADYGQFAAEFAPAKSHCLDWTNNIFPAMLSFPKTIVTQTNNLFNMEETMAAAYLQILVQDPNNASAKTGLSQALTTMQTLIQSQITTAQGLLNDPTVSLTVFGTNITNDAKTLSDIATKALADAGADQTKITQLSGSIDSLKSQIDTLQKWMTISEIGIGLSIFVGLVGAVLCFIPGAQGVGIGLIVIAVAGEATSITGTVLTNKAIAADQDEITSLQKQISDLNQDVILLQGLNKSFEWLQNANMQAQAAMQTIISMWQNLDQTLEDVKTELTDVNNDNTSAQYAQAQTDLQAANTAWQEVVAFANALANLDYKWQDRNGNWHSYTDTPPPLDSATVSKLGTAAQAA